MKAQFIQTIETALQNENFAEALQASGQLIKNYPDDRDSYLYTGDIYQAMHNWSKAIEHYEKVLSICPNDAFAYFKLGDTYELREDYQTALEMYQVARKLEPSNSVLIGHCGRLLHEKGRNKNNINLKKEGMELMERAVNYGETSNIIKNQLAIAYLDQCLSIWVSHPENKDEVIATEKGHLDYTRSQIEKAKELTDGSNVSINNRINELESNLESVEKRKYYGYNYLLKAPAIVGGVFIFFGNTGFGILLLLMAGLYYASQLQPGYLSNRSFVKNNARDPFIIRRINAVAEEIGSITFFGSFMNVIFFRLISRFVFGAITYMMAIVMLPYEIIKGFWFNYDLQSKIAERATS
jgi:tetratricopeptide (TPR) repeat protein